MTKKERFCCAMRRGVPDRVPVSPGISEMIPVRFSGKTYPEVFHYDPLPLWKLRADAERRLDTDAFLHAVPSLLPRHAAMEKKVLREEPLEVVWEETHFAPRGELRRTVRVSHPHGVAVTEPLVKTPADLEKAAGLYQEPSHYDYADYARAYAYLGDDGAMAPYFESPADLISSLMGGPQAFILAHYEDPEVLGAFAAHYTEFACAMLEEFVRRGLPMDVIQIGGAVLSHSVTSPEFFDAYGADFLRRMVAFEREHPDRAVMQLHTCGKSRRVIDQAAALGITAVEPLEEPPGGDVDLAEVKAAYGSRLALKGNLHSITAMLHGTPDGIRREVVETLRIGMPGGAFCLAVGDQAPYDTPEENLRALVETAHEHGVY